MITFNFTELQSVALESWLQTEKGIRMQRDQRTHHRRLIAMDDKIIFSRMLMLLPSAITDDDMQPVLTDIWRIEFDESLKEWAILARLSI